MGVIYKSIPSDKVSANNQCNCSTSTSTSCIWNSSSALTSNSWSIRVPEYDNQNQKHDTTTAYEPITYTFSANDVIKAMQNLSKIINNPNDFKSVKEIVPEKVYEFTFNDNTKIKTIREENDPFNLEYMFYLALAKKLYSKDYTFEGVLMKAVELQFVKSTVKTVKKGIQIFKKAQEEKAKKEEQEAIKKRQHEKYIRKKKEAKARKRNNQINIIAEAIRLSKEEG